LLKWSPNTIKLGAMVNFTFGDVNLLGFDKPLNWIKANDSIQIDSTSVDQSNILKWAWVFKFTKIKVN